MSFKRDGDDSSLLNLLKKRRVSELLAAEIPENEAKLLSNGRFTCTICQNCPIFDTVQILSIHRSGKKHKNALEVLTKQGSFSQQAFEEHSFLTRPTYESVISKSNVNKLENIKKNKNKDSLKKLKDIKEEINILKSNNDKNHLILNIKPYISKIKNHTDLKIGCFNKISTRKVSIHEKMCHKKEDMNSSDDIGSESNIPSFSISKDTSYDIYSEAKANTLTSEQKEKYLKALENGWKRNRDGDWIKGEGVEFDSDDEPPCL